ncbi:MAG TPA: alpha-E domain-containing protein [Beijerinckiaceae bacterium]|nr:alpha-E domain-containing protein [Beijerinckiaceae bacterium]
MLSRTADNLFWLSRYIERAENLARILDVASRMATLPSAYAGSSNEWESAIATAACTDLFHSKYGTATRENVIEFLIASPDNPSSIRQCIETARSNARAVRTAMTAEMWETINDAWLHIQKLDLRKLDAARLPNFLNFVKEASLRFDGAAYRTMLRTDHYWFQRLGVFIERADNTARLLDVKYHVLLPEKEPIGGGLDYFQWSSILRAVSALTSFSWVYRETVKPWLVADFLILSRKQPRSLVSTYAEINRVLDQLSEGYGRRGPSQRLARHTFGKLQNAEIQAIFQGGLHEFLTEFTAENNALGQAINEQYLQ